MQFRGIIVCGFSNKIHYGWMCAISVQPRATVEDNLWIQRKEGFPETKTNGSRRRQSPDCIEGITDVLSQSIPLLFSLCSFFNLSPIYAFPVKRNYFLQKVASLPVIYESVAVYVFLHFSCFHFTLLALIWE